LNAKESPSEGGRSTQGKKSEEAVRSLSGRESKGENRGPSKQRAKNERRDFEENPSEPTSKGAQKSLHATRLKQKPEEEQKSKATC